MLSKTTRAALLGSVAALAFSGAHAQSEAQGEGTVDPEICSVLADRLAQDGEVEPEVRAELEEVISADDPSQCHVVFTAWEEEGTVSRDTLELVGTDQVTQRMIVQQEIEVGADVAVYQPPAEVDVDTGTPEIIWSMPRQDATVDEQSPQVTIRQGRPTVRVELPQPRVTVMIPEPEVTVTWPESTLQMSDIEPQIQVRIPEPVVTVSMPDPVIELTIGDQGPRDLVELDDGRFAPQGATEEDLQPRISMRQNDATVTRDGDAEAPEIVFNRAEPEVRFESEEPEVTVEIIGEPEINISTGRDDREADASGQDEDARRDQAARDEGETLD